MSLTSTIGEDSSSSEAPAASTTGRPTKREMKTADSLALMGMNLHLNNAQVLAGH